MLERAIQIALEAHRGQADKSGTVYILHPLRVMHSVDTETEKIVAVLHDVIEDSAWTQEKLRSEGFTEEVLRALALVTKLPEEENNYEAFINRVKNSNNPIAIKVKLADLKDNMDISRLGQITEKDIERLNRYKRAWQELDGRER